MAASVSTNEVASTLRRHNQQSQSKFAPVDSGAAQQVVLRDTNKRPRVASTSELETQHKKKTESSGMATSSPGQTAAVAYGEEEKSQFPAKGAEREVEDEGGGGVPPDSDISTEIAAIAAKNEQLRVSVASLKRRFSLREDETHQLLLGLGALSSVANELAALQKDYQERSMKNAVLVQESLVQISNCSAQVDTMKSCQGLTAMQLHNFRQECTQEMNRLVSRLGDFAESTCREPEPFEGNDDDVSCAAARASENRQQVEQLKEEVCDYRAQCIEDGSVKSTVGRTQQETTERINLALAQLDKLHAEMFQLRQTLVQENQSFRRHLESLVSRQMAHTREVQDNDTERILEEMDEIRSGMCGILKDIHRLKERTKYLVPSMARPPPRVFGMGSEDRWMGPPGSSITTSMPHYDRSYDGVMPSQMEARYAHPGRPRSSKSSNSSPGRSDDENWRMFPPEDAPATGQRAAQPFESPHYSSRSSSLSGRLSVYGEEHVVPNDEPTTEQFERQLLEQHRLFWIGEGAG